MIRKFLIALAAVSIPLGDQLNPILGFNVSLIFVVALLLAIPYAVANRGIKIPLVYKWFYVFAIVHIVVVYGILHPSLLTERMTVIVMDREVSNELYIIVILRYIVYLLSPVILSKLIADESGFHLFSKMFLGSFIFSIVVCYSVAAFISSSSRFLGGFHDPNTFGGISLIACAISWYYIKKNTIYKLLFVFSIFCVILSGSRACSLGLALGILYTIINGHFSFSTKLLISLMIVGSVVILFNVDNPLLGRFEDIGSNESGDLRVVIWTEYLSNIDSYFLTGTGVGLNFEAFKLSGSMRITHNQYLLQLVQFGIIGFILFISSYIYTLVRTRKMVRIDRTVLPFFVLFLSFLVVMFFSDYDNSREYALLVTIFYCLYNNRKYRYIN